MPASSTGSTTLVMEPVPLRRVAATDAMAYDAYNQCGGSVYRLSNGHYLAAFTASTISRMISHGIDPAKSIGNQLRR